MKTTNKKLTEIGEEISHELAAKMVKDFQDAYPDEIKAQFIGRGIIDKILSQPDCVGIGFFHGLNESGERTLVYVGSDSTGAMLTEYAVIGIDGKMERRQGIVADRSCPGPGVPHDHPDLDWSKIFS